MAGGLFSLFLPALSHAELPVDPAVVHGSATIDTVGNQMTVTNSPNAIINWQDFSIGANHGVHFQQPDGTSQVLNRVVGDDPSHILGSLSSNGGVWLINPHGVLFGQNARIDVGGLVASTLDISNIDFMAGKYNFHAGGTGPGSVKNQGTIHTTFGGRVWLVGGQVRNEGMIQTPGGKTVLAAGKAIEIIDSGAPNVVVRVSAPENRALNLGNLVADGGSVDIHGGIVNQEGIVRADSVGTDSTGRIVFKASDALNLAEKSHTKASGGNVTMAAVNSTYLAGAVDVSAPQGIGGAIKLTTRKLEGMAGGAFQANGVQGGNIRIEGTGLVDFFSTLLAKGAQTGGTIEVTGDQVHLRNANVDASGGIRGGMAHIGGGWQGSGDLPHARQVLIGVGSEVKASGGDRTLAPSAKGGEIAVWSTQSSQHYGLLQARDGGRIELSSKGIIQHMGTIQAGPGGTVMFDPRNLRITDSPSGTEILTPGATFTSNPGVDSFIRPGVISDALDGGSHVLLQANNDIFVDSAIPPPIILFASDGIQAQQNGVPTLELHAGRNITFNANVTVDDGNLIAVAGHPGASSAFRDPGTATLTINPSVNLNVGTGTATLAAINGNFINNNGNAAISTGEGGRWVIYAANPATSTEGFSSYNKHYNQAFVSVDSVPGYASNPSSGNWLLYSIAPTLQVTPSSQTITYGDPGTTIIPSFSGFIDGDTDPAVIKISDAEWKAGPTSTSGNLTAGTHDVAYAGGLVGSLGYQFADNRASSNELMVEAKVITVTVLTLQNKVYDGTTAVPLTASFSGVVQGSEEGEARDVVTLAGTFADKNVGIDKPLTLGLIGPDSGNYILAPVSPAPVADIFLKPITANGFTAQDKVYDGNTNAIISGGTLTGLVAGDTVSFFGATGSFDNENVGVNKPVNISGITLAGPDAANYTLNGDSVAPAMADIIAVIDPVNNPKDKQNTFDTSVQSINAAIYGSFPVLDFVTTGFVNDLAALRAPKFGRLDLSRMSWEDMRRLIEERREFKEKLFADAIYKLELDSTLANLAPCPSLADIRTGLCRITDAQKMALAPQVTEELHKRHFRTKVARLPQIERKFAVLFGVDRYTDKSIPSLENAIDDAEAVAKLFASKLGYEVKVVKNPTKADVVRTLNQLSTEMRANDSVIIYYAGHGYRNDKMGGGYWIPSDASPSDPTTWISNTDVSSMMSDISAKQMVMIADSCYSGTFAEQKLGVSGRAPQVQPDQVLARRSVIVMSSGGDEPVADEGKEGHSIFAWDLMQALRNVDNWQPGTSIFEQVKREVTKSFPQTPQYGAIKSAGHQAGGEYLFEFRQLEDIQ